MDSKFAEFENKATTGISFFTPAQLPPAGTAIDPQPNGKPIPKIFKPLKMRGLTVQNRIMLSPLCQYSCEDGHHTPWHTVHLGGIISRGTGLALVEATSVTANGRISPEDSGLWKDSQMEPLRKTVEYVHSQGQTIGIQLGHAGRKASTLAPWITGRGTAPKQLNGWPDDVYAPSAIEYSDYFPKPRAMTLEEIETFKQEYVAAVKRAVAIGFDYVELHAAHGYLMHQFLSGATNKRTDKYGGSFENRTRLILELIELTRATIPKEMPLFMRISASDFLEETEFATDSWTVDDSIKLAHLAAERGVDFLDVSGGGNHAAQKVPTGDAYQAPFAKQIKKSVGDKLLVGTVGSITSVKIAEEQLNDGLDVVTIGRGFQKNPGLVWAWADELGLEVNFANQMRWGFSGRGKKTPPKRDEWC